MAFGKRSAGGIPPKPAAKPPVAPEAATPAAVAKPAEPKAKPKPAALKPPKVPMEEKVTNVDNRSEEYYATKTTIFNALIDTIDLGQLAQLDQDSAREEIRDIVVEIIAIKNVVMSISEQEH